MLSFDIRDRETFEGVIACISRLRLPDNVSNPQLKSFTLLCGLDYDSISLRRQEEKRERVVTEEEAMNLAEQYETDYCEVLDFNDKHAVRLPFECLAFRIVENELRWRMQKRLLELQAGTGR